MCLPIVVAVVLALLGALPNSTSAISQDELENRVDGLVEAILGCRDIVGLSLAVVKGNTTYLTKGYGPVDRSSNDPASETTLFGIASLTKAFTATLLGQELAINGHTWDTPLRDILGRDFYLYDALRSYHVTSRDIAAHRTGVPSHNYARMQAPARAEMAAKLRFFKPALEFRSSYRYSNLMYGLMTFMTEEMAGQSWEDLTRARIFRPLGMTSTTFTHEEDLSRPDIAKPYMKDANGTWKEVALKFHSDWGALGGSGAIMSNAVDMSQWLRLQLNEGRNSDGQTVVENSVLMETHKPANILTPVSYAHHYQAPAAPITFTQDTYAMGWRRGTYRGRPLSVHTGTSWGYGGLIMILHDEDIAVFTAITGTDGQYTGRYLLQMFIIDLLLGLEPWIDEASACSFPEPWNSAQAAPEPTEIARVDPSLPLDSYTGQFGHFGYGNITFAVTSGGQLQLIYGDLGLWDLTPIGGHRFVGTGRGYIWMRGIKWLQFAEAEGHVSQVTVPFDTLDPPVFVRGLRMSDAPAPPTGEPCADASGRTVAARALIVLTLLAGFVTN